MCIRDRGADAPVAAQVRAANTSLEALQICEQAAIPLGREIAARARAQALKTVRHRCAIDIYCIDRAGNLVGSAVDA